MPNFAKIVQDGQILIDLTQDTVTADKLLASYTAHDASGTQIVGTASAGGGTDVSDTTATASTVRSGYYFYTSAGVRTQGTITNQAAQTIYPSSSDQTIASGKYLSGTQTIKAVTATNLTAANIKSGVTVTVGDSSDADRVASVTGTYTASSSVDTKTATASNYPVSLSFTSMKGQPKWFALRSTSQISSNGNTTYYYIIDMIYNGNSNKYCDGNVFQVGSTRRVSVITTSSTSGYSWSYSGTTLTITSTAASSSASPGAFNDSYSLVYVY